LISSNLILQKGINNPSKNLEEPLFDGVSKQVTGDGEIQRGFQVDHAFQSLPAGLPPERLAGRPFKPK